MAFLRKTHRDHMIPLAFSLILAVPRTVVHRSASRSAVHPGPRTPTFLWKFKLIKSIFGNLGAKGGKFICVHLSLERCDGFEIL